MNMNNDILIDITLPKGIYKTPTRFITENDLPKCDYTHLQILKEDIEKAIEVIKEKISKRDYINRIYELLYYFYYLFYIGISLYLYPMNYLIITSLE